MVLLLVMGTVVPDVGQDCPQSPRAWAWRVDCLESLELWVVSEEGFEFYAEGFSPLALLSAEAVVL